MGEATEEHNCRGPGDRPITAWDFDGTLTVGDSFTAFLRWRSGPARWALGMARLAPAAARYLADRDRGRIKAAAAREFLRGVPAPALYRDAERFCDAVWDRFMRPDALSRWEEWGREGAWRVIVTASPALTVGPFAARLGADALLGTRLQLDREGRVTGAFAGENCRGEEKAVRLRAAYGQGVRLAAAYGDTSGDTEMLAMAAEKGFRVFRGRG